MASDNEGPRGGGRGDGGKEVRVDSRLLYAVLGIVALIAVGAIGLLAGRSGTGNAATPSEGAAAAAAVSGPSQGQAGLTQVGTPRAMPQVDLKMPTTVDGQSAVKFVVKGRSPVRPDEAPIGPQEPRIWFTELADQNWELPLGDIPPTGPVERDVIIENIGTSPLVLVDAGGTCGCTAVVLEAQELAPAGRAVLRIKYDPRVSNDAGKEIRKQIYVRSNDPLAPAAEFHITANVLEQ